MLLMYDLILCLLFIPAISILFIRSPKRFVDDFFPSIAQRFVFDAGARDGDKPFVWMHCASLGEVKALEKLVRMLSQDYEVVITVLTTSARNHAIKNNYSKYVYYAPLDFSFLVKRFINRFRMSSLIVFETELWPGLIMTAKKNNLKVILINGRISVYSFPYYKAGRFIMRSVIRSIDYVSARSAQDMQRFVELGMDPEKIGIYGNIKYDAGTPHDGSTREEFFLSNDAKVFVCASTRVGEEELILDAFSVLRLQFKNLKLIIAPRHIDRINDIKVLLEKRGYSYVLRTEMKGNGFDCLLINTFGELQKVYPLADIVFVGGSLVNKGGQNPIEPAFYSKPVIFGPYMQNFDGEASLLIETGGGLKINDSDELSITAAKLLSDDSCRALTGRNARQVVEKQMGVVDRTYSLITGMLKNA